MTTQTRWLKIGEPLDNDRVEATIRTTYQTGPNERPREDDIREGSVAIEALDMMDDSEEIQRHTHDDGSILLSALSGGVEEELLASFDEGDYEVEILESDVSEGDDWEFRADARIRLNNPHGMDVIAIRTYKTRPKYGDLTSDPGKIHEYTAYWWPDSYPAHGDMPITDASATWEPAADIEDDDALLEECVESATNDPQAEIEGLASQSDRIARILGQSR